MTNLVKKHTGDEVEVNRRTDVSKNVEPKSRSLMSARSAIKETEAAPEKRTRKYIRSISEYIR